LTPELFANSISLHDTVLIGAVGVGNGFIWAADGFDLHGEMDVADPKAVAYGNLNRCRFFSEDNLNQNKAEVLCAKAPLPNLKFVPFVGTFQTLRKQRKRIKRVIVTADSRPARRSIQNELPFEVLDASTTDVSAVVIHAHAQPTNGACLSCIYRHIPREDEQARSIAEGLGITVDEVRQEFIDVALARKLVRRHPSLSTEALEGRALTTLYKELCSAQALKTAAGEQALAPFAFVSHLAGALLFLELLRFEAGICRIEGTNYLNLDPWLPPHGRARRERGRMPGCEFCGDPSNLSVFSAVWSDVLTAEKITVCERTT
jgi:molybdopterin/thiamine biosynthesis adenylyltransferase